MYTVSDAMEVIFGCTPYSDAVRSYLTLARREFLIAHEEDERSFQEACVAAYGADGTQDRQIDASAFDKITDQICITVSDLLESPVGILRDIGSIRRAVLSIDETAERILAAVGVDRTARSRMIAAWAVAQESCRHIANERMLEHDIASAQVPCGSIA